MPEEGIALQPRSRILTFDEIVRFATLCAAEGVRKIRLTGGEPLVRRGLPALAARLRAIPGIETLCVTTNGTLLATYVQALRRAGVEGVNISLDTMRAERFRCITRRDDYHAVMAGIGAALEAGFSTVKINVVVMRGINDDELPAFVRWTASYPLQIRFIEYMPFDANAWSGDRLVTASEMRETLSR